LSGISVDNVIGELSYSVWPLRSFSMATDTTIPVEVSNEAREHIAELGMQREFEEMIEHAKQALPGVRWIDVAPTDSPEEPGDLRILISPHRPPSSNLDEVNRAEWDYIGWFVRTFPPKVCENFCVLSFFEANDGW
jgi:hypothetical protein